MQPAAENVADRPVEIPGKRRYTHSFISKAVLLVIFLTGTKVTFFYGLQKHVPFIIYETVFVQ
jgi:hypothetical protein